MIDLVLAHIQDFEQWLKMMQSQLDSKQSTRIFSNNVWLRDHLEEQLTKHLEPAKRYLNDLKRNAPDSTVEMNVTASIKHCDEAIHLIQRLVQMHKQNPSDAQARNQWNPIIPTLFATLNHLRNRLTITNSLLKNTKEREKENWLNEL